MSYITNSGCLNLYTKSYLNQDPDSNVGKLWGIIGKQVDELETQTTTLKNILYIQTTTGLNLDKVGLLLNQFRASGQTDEEYKLDLITAIMQEIATATIPDLVNLGKIVAGNNDEALFRPYEMYLLPAISRLLDATIVLDGTEPMSPAIKKYASVECRIEGAIDFLKIPIKVAAAIGKIRGAGIGTYFHIIFKTMVSIMTRYAGNLSAPLEIALGDGATRDPQPEDTGLQNEVYRKAINQFQFANGDWGYYIIIPTTDLNDKIINEEALFDSSGNMIMKYVFDGKEKNDSLVNE